MLNLPAGCKAYFVSDLHLSKDTPKTLEAFEHWLASVASSERQIFLLGDIFEVWLGDDYSDDLSVRVSKALLAAEAAGAKIHFMHGNRDFLIGEDYCERSGMDLLPDPEFIDCNNMALLITHGDQLCTDDKTYQKFRNLSRSDKWISDFLGKPIEERIQFAKMAREESKRHQSKVTSEIMDVNQADTEAVYKGRWPDGDYVGRTVAIIHGHTHRCAAHGDEKPGLLTESYEGQIRQGDRLVLPDWDFDSERRTGAKGGYLTLLPSGHFEMTLFH